MRRVLEHVRPDVVEQVDESVLAAEAEHAQRDVLYGRHGRLSVNEIPAGETKPIFLINDWGHSLHCCVRWRPI